ncbi:hypothetical protein AWB65_06215 [Caballeronia humi]|uniref:Uncharacterized protein n=1 Tax=Caballeronia humi TaxID=326474 RepID=A0A158JAX2_9BURK|nr:hypothetical protein AWB65_06215 [Caballeronia humi]
MMQQTMQQLDIFADSRDVALRNDVVEQLQRRNAADARKTLMLLACEYATDSALPAMTVLVRELENASTLPVTDHAELAALLRRLENGWQGLPDLAPTDCRSLGQGISDQTCYFRLFPCRSKQ